MIDLHYWTRQNDYKITMFFEETLFANAIIPVNVRKGEQFKPRFLEFFPNNGIPEIVNHARANGGASVSGGILLYLAEKTQRLIKSAPRDWIQAFHAPWQAGSSEHDLKQSHSGGRQQ
jgi:GSH-dependent disulfide-bond oxidoreductase